MRAHCFWRAFVNSERKKKNRWRTMWNWQMHKHFVLFFIFLFNAGFFESKAIFNTNILPLYGRIFFPFDSYFDYEKKCTLAQTWCKHGKNCNIRNTVCLSIQYSRKIVSICIHTFSRNEAAFECMLFKLDFQLLHSFCFVLCVCFFCLFSANCHTRHIETAIKVNFPFLSSALIKLKSSWYNFLTRN